MQLKQQALSAVTSKHLNSPISGCVSVQSTLGHPLFLTLYIFLELAHRYALPVHNAHSCSPLETALLLHSAVCSVLYHKHSTATLRSQAVLLLLHCCAKCA
jgi:hypothetical protein